jgi:hypothetical protein
MFVEVGPDNAAAQSVCRGIGFADTNGQLLMLPLVSPTHSD